MMFLGHTEILRTEKYVHSGDKDGKCYVTSLGNDAGDDFGKFTRENRKSTRRCWWEKGLFGEVELKIEIGENR